MGSTRLKGAYRTHLLPTAASLTIGDARWREMVSSMAVGICRRQKTCCVPNLAATLEVDATREWCERVGSYGVLAHIVGSHRVHVRALPEDYLHVLTWVA